MEFLRTHWFLITMLVIATTLTFVWLFVFNKKKLNAKWWEIIILCLIHTGYGVLTVKFFALLEVGFNFEKAGSMSLYGGIFFMPIMYIAYALIKKLPMGMVFDIFVVPLAATLALARINCLHAGCCIGIEIGSNGFRWPAREVDILIHLLFLVFIIPWIQKDKSSGRAYPIYMIAYGIGRFGNQWLREPINSSPLQIGHIFSIVSVILGAIWLLIPLIITKKKGAEDNETN